MNKFRSWLVKSLFLATPFVTVYTLLLAFGEPMIQARRLAKDFETVQTGDFEFVISTKLEFIAETRRAYEERLIWFKEEFSRRYKDLFHLSPLDIRLTIYLCRNHDELMRHGWTTLHRDLTNNGGFYNPERREIAVISTRSIQSDYEALFHEMTHAMLDLGGSGDPLWSPWLHEGLATYFEESIYNQQLGGLDPNAVRLVKSMLEENPPAPFIPLVRLLESSSDAFATLDNTSYYAEAHLLTYYLMTLRSAQFSQYLAEERKPGRLPAAIFEQIFGPLNEVENDFKEFVRRRPLSGS